MTDQAADERPQTKPFSQFVREMRNGALHTELSDGLAELVNACLETGKKGAITLKVSVAPTKDGLTVIVSDDVKVAAPKPDARPSTFFADEHGNLSREHPDQAELPFRAVAGGRTDHDNDDGREATTA